MLLNIKIDQTNRENYDYLNSLYTEHNHYHEGDSGLDLYCPEEIIVEPGETKKINLNISCEATKKVLQPDENDLLTYMTMPTSYFLYPRSSIIKTPLRMANSVGIIDAGYRGNIIACVDNIKNESFTIEKGTRLFQICSPDLSPLKFNLVNTLTETSRGEGGFGSTNN